MIKSRVKIDEEVQKAISRKTYFFGILCLTIGLLGILGYLFTSFLEEEKSIYEIMLIFALPLGIGICLLLIVKKLVKEAKKQEVVNIYEFDYGFVNINSIKNKENIGALKIYYNEFTKLRDTKKYLLLYYTQKSVFPVDKSNLTVDELTKLYELLNVKRRKH